MDATKYDKNFVRTEVTDGGKKLYTLPDARFSLFGGFYEEGTGFVRMPTKTAQAVSEGVGFLATNCSGLRLNFTTNSKTIKLIVEESSFGRFRHICLTGSTGFVLCSREGENMKHVFCGLLCPEWSDGDCFEASAYLDGKTHDYLLYFPLYSSVKSLKIELDENAELTAGKGYKDVAPVLYYGSSITQGGCANRADNSYQDMISERTNLDYVNLGFSGCGMAEDAMTDYLSTIDCSIFVCDYDLNAPNAEYLQATHERLYKRYRKIKKDVPIVFVTRPDAKVGNKEDKIRAEIVKTTYENAKKSGDDNVWFVDGREFFPEEVRERCLVDGCHPTDLGFYFMAKKIGTVIEEIIKEKHFN